MRSASGEILQEKRVRTQRLGALLEKQKPSRVIVETSCNAFAVADLAQEAGHEVRVVPALLVRALGVGQRGLKERRARCASVERGVGENRFAVGAYSDATVARGQSSTRITRCAGARPDAAGELRQSVLPGASGTAPRGTPKTIANNARQQAEQSERPLPIHIESLLQVLEVHNAQIALLDEQLKEICDSDERMRRL